MASVELEIQRAIFSRLTQDAAVAALVGGGVYDRVPQKPSYPYIELGESNFQRQDGVGLDAGVVFLTLQAWSDKPGYPEVKQIADAVVAALHVQIMNLPTNTLITIEHRYTNTLRDLDGLTSRAVINFAAYTQKPTLGA